MKVLIKDKKISLDELLVFSGDKGVDVVTFECENVYNGILLDDIPVYIKLNNSLGGQAKKQLQSVKSDDRLLIDWVIDDVATAVSGQLSCQICFESIDGNTILNSSVFNVEVKPSVKNNNLNAQVLSNPVLQMQNQLLLSVQQVNSALESKFVTKINGQSGEVNITAQSIGALRSGDNVSLLNNDCGYITLDDIPSLTAESVSGLNQEQLNNAITSHEQNATAHQNILTQITSASQLATQAINIANSKSGNGFYTNIKEMITALSNSETNYKSGDSIYIYSKNVPDFWVISKIEQFHNRIYTTDQSFLNMFKSAISVNVGYFKISVMEGSAPDLSNYVSNTLKINGKALSGDVNLTAQDVGAVSTQTVNDLMPKKISDLTDDTDYLPVKRAYYDENGVSIAENYVKSTDYRLNGVLQKYNFVPSTTTIQLQANRYIRINIVRDSILSLSDGNAAYDNVWKVEITQDSTVKYTIAINNCDCFVGGEPTFECGTTTLLEFYKIGNLIHCKSQVAGQI